MTSPRFFVSADSTGLSVPPRSVNANERGENVEFDAQGTEGTEFRLRLEKSGQMGSVMSGVEGEENMGNGRISRLNGGSAEANRRRLIVESKNRREESPHATPWDAEK